MDSRRIERLLSDLCVTLGLCLAPEDTRRLALDPPSTLDAFTAAVFAAEGLDERLADRELVRRVRSMVVDAFERAERDDLARATIPRRGRPRR